MQEADITPVHRLALQHLDRVAIKDSHGSHTYMDVLLKALRLSKLIKDNVGQGKRQERIGFLCSNDVTYVVTQWACWAAGHIGTLDQFTVLFKFQNICFFCCSCPIESISSSSTFKLLH